MTFIYRETSIKHALAIPKCEVMTVILLKSAAQPLYSDHSGGVAVVVDLRGPRPRRHQISGVDTSAPI